MSNEFKLVKLLDSFGITLNIDANGVNSNYSAIVDPTATDDISTYQVGSHWVNVTTNQVFICVDSTASNAIWENVTESSTDINTKVSNADTTTGFLEDKIVAGANITINKLNAGGNEQLEIVGSAGITDHTLLSNIGANTHAQIDTHIADSTIHFTQAAISIPASQISDFDTEVSNNTDVSANTAARHTHANKALLDTYTQTEASLADAVSKKHTQGTDLGLDTGGANPVTAATITGHIADSTIHFTQAAIALAASQITSGTFDNARISQSSVTQHQAAIDHDQLLNYSAARHKLHPTSTDNAVSRYDGTSGDLQDSLLGITDTGNLEYLGAGTFNITNILSGTSAVKIGPRVEINTSYNLTDATPILNVNPNLNITATNQKAISFSPTLTMLNAIGGFGNNIGTTFASTLDTGAFALTSGFYGADSLVIKSGVGTATQATAHNYQLQVGAGTVTEAIGLGVNQLTTVGGTVVNGTGMQVTAGFGIFGGTHSGTSRALKVISPLSGATKISIDQQGTERNDFSGIINANNGLKVTGSWSYNGLTPTASQTGWGVTNPVTNRALDVSTATLAQLTQVVGTLIDDLKTKGIILA